MGGRKKVTVGYKYLLGMHLALCHGVVDRLSRIRVGGRQAWIGDCAEGRLNIDAPNLFGGEEREGGVSGAVDFVPGRPTEAPNDYLQARLGANIPAFRGVACAVLRQVYTGMNPYLKPWGFRLQRIHKTTDGAVQWYDAKAAIGTDAAVLHDSLNLSAATYAGENPSAGFTVSGFAPSDVILLELPAGAMYQGWSAWPSDGYAPLPWSYSFRVTTAEGVTTSYLPTWYSTAAEAYAAAQARFPLILTGSSSYTIWMADVNPPDNRGGLSFRVTRLAAQIDMNPAHIIRECETDPDWGMGYPAADFDDAAFTAAADRLYAEDMGISLLWDRSGPIEDFIGEIARHIDAALYVDPTTGKFTLKLIRDDYDPNSLPVLDPSNIESLTDFARPALGELINAVTVNYWDAASGKDASLTVQDIALQQIQGATIGQTVHYPGFTNATIAARVAQRDLRALSTPLASCTIIAHRAAAGGLNPGDVFKLTWPAYGIQEMVMRVTRVAYGDGRNQRVRLTCTQDAFALPTQTMIPAIAPAWEDPAITTPAALTRRLVFEMPYLDLAQQFGAATIDSLIATDPAMGFVGAAAGREQSGTINARLMTDAGAGYTDAGAVDFCPIATLAADITRTATIWSLSGVEDLDAIEAGTWAQIDSEIVAVIAVTTDSITVKRGALDTVPATHAAGATLFFWDEYSGTDLAEYLAGESVSVKLLPTTGSATLALDDAPVDVVDLVGRAARPYPPGNVKVNAAYFPATIPGPDALALTWAHRDRTQQTGEVLIGFTDGNVGPEPGTTYTARLYGETDTLLRTLSGLTGTDYYYHPLTEIIDSNLIMGSGDPYFAQTVLLLPMDGPNASTAFIDIKGRTVTANGGAQIRTAQSKFGGASAYFDGSSDYLTLAHDTAFQANTDITVEAWVYPTDLSAQRTIASKRGATTVDEWTFYMAAGGKVGAAAWNTTGGVFFFAQDPTALSINQWTHVAFSVQGTTVRLFRNGELVASGSASGTYQTNTAMLNIGRDASNTTRDWLGYIDDLRITKGVARYTASFPTPTRSLLEQSGLRQNGQLRVELESVRDGLTSYQKHNHTVARAGYGFQYGNYYGGV